MYVIKYIEKTNLVLTNPCTDVYCSKRIDRDFAWKLECTFLFHVTVNVLPTT
jgi:hypothetical protein